MLLLEMMLLTVCSATASLESVSPVPVVDEPPLVPACELCGFSWVASLSTELTSGSF